MDKDEQAVRDAAAKAGEAYQLLGEANAMLVEIEDYRQSARIGAVMIVLSAVLEQ